MLSELAGLSTSVSDENLLTPVQTVTGHVRFPSREFRKIKTSSPNAVSDIPAEHPNMVALSEVDLASCRGCVQRVFVRFVPPLNYRKHEQCTTARGEYAINLLKRFGIVDVFKNVGTHHDVERLVG